MIRVAITDDHLMITKGLAELLSALPDIVQVATYMSVEETRSGLAKDQPDVLLLDLHLPDGDGVLFCKEVKRSHPQINVLIITTYNQAALIKSVMRNGASGFLLKNASLNELHEAITAAYNGEQYLQADVKNILLRNAINHNRPSTYQPVLSRREKEVLLLIIDEFTTQEIADKLFIAVKTVETHRMHLMNKLGAKNIAGLVKIALERGLC